MIWLWEPSTTDQYLQLLDSYPSDAPKLTKWLRKLPQASTLLSHSSTSINKKCFFFLSWINAAFRHVFFCLFLISLHLTNPWKRALHYGLRLKKKGERDHPNVTDERISIMTIWGIPLEYFTQFVKTVLFIVSTHLHSIGLPGTGANTYI